MSSSLVGSGFSSQIVQFNCSDSFVDTIDDLKREVKRGERGRKVGGAWREEKETRARG